MNMDFDIASHLKEIENIVASCTPEIFGSEAFNVEDVLEVANEQQRLLKGLEENASQLQSDYKAAKEKYGALEKDKANVKKDLAKLKDDDATLTKKLMRYKTDITNCNHKLDMLKRQVAINKKEEELMIKQEKELHAYHALTGLRWSFQCPKNVKEGIITNPKTNFVKAFSISSTLPNKEITDTLWSYIKESATESWDSVDEDKENRNENK